MLKTLGISSNAVLVYANKKGLTKVKFIEETISSRKNDRAIYDLIDKLQAGDNLIIFELSVWQEV